MDVSAKIITQFVRDLSFENQKGPGAFQQGEEKPSIKANVDVKASNRKDTDIYEIELNVSVAGIRGNEKIYVVIYLIHIIFNRNFYIILILNLLK